MVRNSGGDYVEDFRSQGIVAIGWSDLGSLATLKTREQIIEKVRERWPEYKPLKAVVSGSQLNKIANIIAIGDRVITYDPAQRIYYLGTVVGPYVFEPTAVDGLANQRKVRWESEIARDLLSAPSKNSLGATLTVFEVPERVAAEIEALSHGTQVVGSKLTETIEAEESSIETHDALKSKAEEFIKDQLIALDWEEMQELIAGLLRAMGYKTRVSPSGSDRGKDIVASPDGLGLEQPRIVVEVKHRQGQIGAPEIRSYLGGRHKDDKGLYVSTGGFTRDAKYEADRASIPLTLMDSTDLVALVVEYYERLDLPTQTLLPLTRIYWPTRLS